MITKLSCCLHEHITLLSGFNYFCLEICQSYCSSFKQNVSCSAGFFQGCSHYPRCPIFAVMLRINPAMISLNFLSVFIQVCSDFRELAHNISSNWVLLFYHSFYIFISSVWYFHFALNVSDVIFFPFLWLFLYIFTFEISL